MTLYNNLKILYPELQDHKYIGGYHDKNTVHLWYREDGERKWVTVKDVPHYFCVSKADYKKLPKAQWTKYKDSGIITQGRMIGDYLYIEIGEDVYKTTLDNFFSDLDDLGVKPLEGDINRTTRLMIDLNLRVAGLDDPNPPKIAFYDIETDDRGSKIRIGVDRILSVAWKDYQTGNEEFFYCTDDTDEAEKEFLSFVYSSLTDYDILVGYNNYNFDNEYLLGRFEYYGFDTYKYRRCEQLDMYNLFERLGVFSNYKSKNKRLDTIARAIVGKGKLDHSEKIYDLWRYEINTLREYNLEDVRLIYDMEKKVKSAALVVGMCGYSGLLHSSNYSPAKVVDMFILRKSQARRESGVADFRFPTQYFRPEHKMNGKTSPFSRNALSGDKRKGRAEYLKEEYDIDFEPVQGAYVKDALPGLYSNVAAFDFNSLYPNTIIAFNIGHDTLVTDTFGIPYNTAPNGITYRTDYVSSMSESVEFLINQRKKIRAEMTGETDPVILESLDVRQRSTKELTNSFYGVTAQWGARYYNKSVAESITSSGRLFLPFGEEYFEALGYKVIIGDTDSLYLKIDDTDKPEELIADYLSELKEMLVEKFNVYRPDVLKMGYEKQYSRVLIVAKKLYAGWLTMKDGKEVSELDIKGLGAKKGNFPKWGKEISTQVLLDLLTQDFTDNHYIRLLEAEKIKLENGEFDIRDLLVAARLGKPLDEYKSKLCHVTIAKRLAEKGILVNAYSTINYAITNGETPMQGIDISEMTNDTELDGQYYFNKVLMGQVESYLEVAFPHIEWSKYRYPRNLKRKPFRLMIKPKKLVLENIELDEAEEGDDEE